MQIHSLKYSNEIFIIVLVFRNEINYFSKIFAFFLEKEKLKLTNPFTSMIVLFFLLLTSIKTQLCTSID